MGLGLRAAFVLLRTVMVVSVGEAVGAGDFSAVFFVLGQIRRHGWLLIVLLNSAMFFPAGSSSCMVAFSLSDESRKFCNVTWMLSFCVRLSLIFWMFLSELFSGLSGAVMSTRCAPKVLNCASA